MDTLKNINQKTREAYNKAAEKYKQLFYNELDKKEFDRNILDEFSSYFHSDSIVLDAGCGPCGHTTSYLSKKGFNVIGIDISEKCIELAMEHNSDVHFEVGDFSELKYRNNYFDGIISYYSLIDTPKIFVKNVLYEFKRVLKPGGVLLLTVKEGRTEGYQNELLGIEVEIFFTLFTKDEIRLYLTESGFEIITLHQRQPYTDEIEIDRIFVLAKKNMIPFL